MMRDESIPTLEDLRSEVINTLRTCDLPEDIKQRINIAFTTALARLHATRPRPADPMTGIAAGASHAGAPATLMGTSDGEESVV